VIVYLDASALVKRYVAEPGSTDVASLVAGAEAVATTVITRVEVAAALGRASRMKLIAEGAAAAALEMFSADWHDLIRLPVDEALTARAAALSWQHELRGYDAVHLAAALSWREMLGDAVTLATYDRALWKGAQASGLAPWPAALAR